MFVGSFKINHFTKKVYFFLYLDVLDFGKYELVSCSLNIKKWCFCLKV